MRKEPTDELWIWAQQQREQPAVPTAVPERLTIRRLAKKFLSVGQRTHFPFLSRSKSL